MKKNISGDNVKIAEMEFKGGKISVSETETGDKGAFTYTDRNGKTLMTIGKPLGITGFQQQIKNPGSSKIAVSNTVLYSADETGRIQAAGSAS